jgi:hypothetical protein
MMKTILLLHKTTAVKLIIGEQTVDSGADKFLVDVSEDGAWVLLECYGPIICEGFDASSKELKLGIAETVIVTKKGETIILQALQAVVHTLKLSTRNLIDPTAMAAAGGDIEVDFKTSTGTIKFGNDEIELKARQGGICFSSRKPTKLEAKTLRRIIVVPENYNKQKFMRRGNEIQKSMLRRVKGKSHKHHTLRLKRTSDAYSKTRERAMLDSKERE